MDVCFSGPNGSRAQNRGADSPAGRGNGKTRGRRRVLRNLSYLRREGDGRWASVPSYGQPLSHQLFHLLLVRTRAQGQSLLQRPRESLLRRRLHGRRLLQKSHYPAILLLFLADRIKFTVPIRSSISLFSLSVFRLPADC